MESKSDNRYYAKALKAAAETVAYADLSISHKDLEPDYISQKLSLSPTHSCKTGDKLVRGGKANNGVWYFSTRKNVMSNELDEHLRFLAAALFGKTPIVRHLQNQGVKFKICCTVISTLPAQFITISSEMLSQLGRMDATLELRVLTKEPRTLPD